MEELKALLTRYVIMPVVAPDIKALAIAGLAAGAMILVSLPLAVESGGLTLRDCFIPSVLFVYMYFHYYNRKSEDVIGTLEDIKRAAVDIDEALSDGKLVIGRQLWKPQAAQKIEVLVVLSLGSETSGMLVPFDSICRRHSSERLGFVAAAKDSDLSKVRSFTDEFDGRFSFSILGCAEKLMTMNVKRKAIFILRIDSERVAKLAWHGHVASLESAISQYFSVPDDSSDEDDEGESEGDYVKNK